MPTLTRVINLEFINEKKCKRAFVIETSSVWYFDEVLMVWQNEGIK